MLGRIRKAKREKEEMKVRIKGIAELGEVEFDINEMKGKSVLIDGKKVGEITDVYYEDGELRYEGTLEETDKLPTLRFFYKKEDDLK